MKLEGDDGFHHLAMEAILALCMNDINGKRITNIEGFLSVTVESGQVFCIVIKEALDGAEVNDEEFVSSDSGSSLHSQKWFSSELDISRNEKPESAFAAEENHVLPPNESLSSDKCDYDNSKQMKDEISAAQVKYLTLDVNGKHSCLFCNKSFKTVCRAKRHIRTEHNAINTVYPSCGYAEPRVKQDLILCGMKSETGADISEMEYFDESTEISRQIADDLELIHSDNFKMVEIYSGGDDILHDLDSARIKSEFLHSSYPSDVSHENVDKQVAEVSEELLTGFYKCPECAKSFGTNICLKQHVKIEHGYAADENSMNAAGSKRFMCYKCHKPKTFTSRECLFRHRQRLHSMEKCAATGQLMYRCFTCCKFFKDQIELGKHRKFDHRAKPFACDICHIWFSSQGSQLYHRLKFHRKHACNQCQEIFKGLIAFTDHVHTSHPGVPVYKINTQLVCEFCSAIFADDRHLDDHIKSKHLGVVHMCDTCGKVLGTAETLKVHRKLHKLDTYRTCEVCGRQFGRLAGLMEHMRSYHPEKVPEKYRRTFSCGHCGLSFTRRETMRRHVENKHECKTFTCDVCGKVFRCKRYIARHKKTHHPSNVVTKVETNV